MNLYYCSLSYEYDSPEEKQNKYRIPQFLIAILKALKKEFLEDYFITLFHYIAVNERPK